MEQNCKMYNLLLLVIVLSDHSNSDKTFEYFKSELQETFQNTPKVWQNYVRMFLHGYIKKNQFKSFKLSVFKILKYSLIFLKSRNKSWESNGIKSGRTREFGVLQNIKK